MSIKRDIREDIENDFDRKTTFVHNIDFFDVAIDVTNEIIAVANIVINEMTMMIAKSEENFFDFLQCFIRTCS